MKSKIKLLALFSAFIFSMVSCTSYKNVPYLQNSAELKNIEQLNVKFDARVQPKDLLIINVVSPSDPNASMPYNLTIGIPYEYRQTVTSTLSLQTYMVDNEGFIDYPVVGKMKVSGLTTSEIEDFIFSKIKTAFVDEPIVTVRFSNFKISVLGEVNSPGLYTIQNEKVTIFEALAMARDLTIYGRRDNVKLIRENVSGEKEIHEINLNDVSVLSSPYYYLQQNDVLYVTPNKAKSKNSDIGSSTSLWFSATSILISLTSLLYNILR